MKRFRLIEEHSTVPGLTSEQAEADRVDYIHCIRLVMRTPLNPQAGVQLEEMEQSIRVLRALDGKEIGDILELEDADHQHLCEKVRNMRWTAVDERLVRFSHTILNATESVLDAPTPTPRSEPIRPEPNGYSSNDATGSSTLSITGRVDGRARSVRSGRKSSPA